MNKEYLEDLKVKMMKYSIGGDAQSCELLLAKVNQLMNEGNQ